MFDKIVVFERARKIYLTYRIIPANGRRFDKTFRYKIYLMFCIFFAPAIIGNYLYLWRTLTKDQVSLSSTLECLQSNAVLMATAITGWITLNFGNDVFEFFYHLGIHKFEEPDGLAEVYKRHDKITIYLYFIAEVTLLGRVALGFYKNSYCEAKANYSDERYLCGMMLPCWFPFRLNIVARIWIFLCTNALFALYIPLASISYFVVYGVCDLIVLRMLKMKEMLKQLDFKGSHEMIENQLVECIKYHSELWSLVKKMNNSLGWCHACQYFLVSSIIALKEYEALVSFNVTSVLELCIYIVGEIMVCSAGQTIENEREAMASGLYMTPWYELPIKVRKTFVIFLGKLQMPLHLEAKPVVHINYEFLMKVLKGSYTFLMFLQKN